MADPDLKSIPTKTLKKVVSECQLGALVSSDEGQAYFDSHLSRYPEFNKYWTFYKAVNQIILNSDNQEQLLESLKQSFFKHIAIEADSEDRIDSCLKNRSVVDNLSKAINESNSEKLLENFKILQESSFEYLNKQVFHSLLPQFNSEYSSRRKSCDLS